MNEAVEENQRTLRDEIKQILLDHHGTAGTFCAACPGWVPLNYNVEDEDIWKAEHQANMVLNLLVDKERS